MLHALEGRSWAIMRKICSVKSFPQEISKLINQAIVIFIEIDDSGFTDTQTHRLGPQTSDEIFSDHRDRHSQPFGFDGETPVRAFRGLLRFG